MKESHRKDLASHPGPESCAGARKGMGEALTGEDTGRVLSRENRFFPGADVVKQSGRQKGCARKGESTDHPARSETSCTCGSSMHENREIPCSPPNRSQGGRGGKAGGRTPPMHEHGKSDRPIVPMKSPNKTDQHAAEVVEGRGLTKENLGQSTMCRTQSWSKT